MTEIKVMVVDDSPFMRRVISDIINGQADMKVVATARNGEEALLAAKRFAPDVITMDVEMPVMDGLEALQRIMKDNPLPVVMLSSVTKQGADATVKALHLGAVDFITKPSGTLSPDINEVARDIVKKIRIAALARDKLRLTQVRVDKRIKPPKVSPAGIDKARKGYSDWYFNRRTQLHEVIPKLPGNIPAAVLVVQHMPPGFTRSLAERINGMSALNVKEAEEGEPVLSGTVYIAPGDYHLKVKRLGEGLSRRLVIKLTQEPLVSGHCPQYYDRICSARILV